jgi:arylsulfatase A
MAESMTAWITMPRVGTRRRRVRPHPLGRDTVAPLPFSPPEMMTSTFAQALLAATRSAFVLLSQALALALSLCLAPAAFGAKQPNIVLILLDDMGYRDVGFAGNKYISTPNIDKLAQSGVVFSQCYASAPNCAPTRACLLTGQYAPRHGVYTVVDDRYAPGQPHMKVTSTTGNDELPAKTKTVADVLKSNGYATALIGMWNLGRGRNGSPGSPLSRGFDVYKRPDDVKFEKDAYMDGKGRYLSDALCDEALAWIDQHKSKPFFLYYAEHSVHEPFDPKPELVAKYKAKTPTGLDKGITPEYAATVEAVDFSIGRIMAKLEADGLTKDTLVIFTSDNGGLPYVVNPLRGSKGLLYEGGIRVPGAVSWPGVIPAGKTYDEPVASMDFMPTILEAAGIPLPKDQPTDGISLLRQLKSGAPLGRDAIYWHFPCYIGKGEPMSLLRAGDYKLIQKFAGPTFELYDVKKDPGEAQDLAKTQPAKVEELKNLLVAWQKDTGAFLADKKNEAYDPNAKEQRGGGKKKR